MNGITTIIPAEERAARKRQLHEDLVLVRTQKAEVLRQIQQIAKKQKTSAIGGPLSVEDRRLLKREEQRRRMEAIWATCLKILQEMLKNANTKTYFGEPVKVDYAANYYQIIKSPMDLGTIKSERPRPPAVRAALGRLEHFWRGWSQRLVAEQSGAWGGGAVARARPGGVAGGNAAGVCCCGVLAARLVAAMWGAVAAWPTASSAGQLPTACLRLLPAGKLDRRKYSDVYAFRDDVRLVFNNCRDYNPPGNFVRNFGDQVGGVGGGDRTGRREGETSMQGVGWGVLLPWAGWWVLGAGPVQVGTAGVGARAVQPQQQQQA